MVLNVQNKRDSQLFITAMVFQGLIYHLLDFPLSRVLVVSFSPQNEKPFQLSSEKFLRFLNQAPPPGL